jgi:hypothetical protein
MPRAHIILFFLTQHSHLPPSIPASDEVAKAGLDMTEPKPLLYHQTTGRRSDISSTSRVGNASNTTPHDADYG